jgi:hypothetical protein
MLQCHSAPSWRQCNAGHKLKDVLAREVHLSDEYSPVEVDNLISPATIASSSTYVTEAGDDVFLCRNAYLHRELRFAPLSLLENAEIDGDFRNSEDAPSDTSFLVCPRPSFFHVVHALYYETGCHMQERP